MIGVIPTKLESLSSIANVDLSHNSLTDMIPLDFQNCITLEPFNVSFNHLVGPIPSDGIFRNITASSFVGNQGLCSGILTESPCTNSNVMNPSSNYSHVTKKTGPTLMLVVVIVLVIAILLLGIRCFCKYYISQVSRKGCMTKENPQIPWNMTSL